MFYVQVILFLILTLVFRIPAAAQQRDQKSRKPNTTTQTAVTREPDVLRLSAISLLYSLAQKGNEIDNIGERVRVLAEIGDAFWPVDQDYARATLVRDFKEIEKLQPSWEGERERLTSQKRALRRIVLSRIARHEPTLASQLIHDLPSEIPTADEKAMQRHGIPTPNADALLGIAENVLDSDPKRAAALAGYSLQDGLSQRLRLFLAKLRAKDSAASDGLIGAALTEAAVQHPGRLFDVMVLWDYAYQPQDFYFNGIVWNREASGPRYSTSQSLRKLVLAFAVSAIMENLQRPPVSAQSAPERQLAQAEIASLYSVIQQLLPSMQVDWPQGAIDLQQALVRVEQELQAGGQAPPSRPPNEDDAQSGLTAVDSLLEKAAAASQGVARDSLYLAASFKLLQLGQCKRGKEVAARIDDQERRATIDEPLNFRLAGELAEQGSLPDALDIANQLKTPELRIGSLARIGSAFLQRGDAASGLQILATAQSVASKADPTIEVSAATLRIATAFIKDDPIRASELITLAIQIMNKVKEDDTPWVLLAPAGAVDALSLSWKNADGRGLKSVKAVYPRNGGLANLLLKLDFNQAVALAGGINRKALSFAVQAAICRAAIESTQDKITTARSN